VFKYNDDESDPERYILILEVEFVSNVGIRVPSILPEDGVKYSPLVLVNL